MKCYLCQENLMHGTCGTETHYYCNKCGPCRLHWCPTFISYLSENNKINWYHFMFCEKDRWYKIYSNNQNIQTSVLQLFKANWSVHNIVTIPYYHEVTLNNYQEQFPYLIKRLKIMVPFS